MYSRAQRLGALRPLVSEQGDLPHDTAIEGEALRSEARRRVEADEFFGHIAYVSLITEKPGLS